MNRHPDVRPGARHFSWCGVFGRCRRWEARDHDAAWADWLKVMRMVRGRELTANDVATERKRWRGSFYAWNQRMNSELKSLMMRTPCFKTCPT